MDKHLQATFTPRELEILRLVGLGLSNRDIAEELVVAPETVRWYTKQIYSKLGVHGRVPALVRAKEWGLLEEAASSKTETVTLPQRPRNHNLPASTTSFIGRIYEIAEVKCLLQTSRLLTLTGVGGTGKTRLSLRVASEVLDDFTDGVYFVDLAPVTDPSLVEKAIAAVLGIIENLNEPLLDTLKRILAEREMLLLIDNFEHVVEAAPLISGLLAAASRLKVLVTSREALRLSGEQEYSVPPLSLPPADTISIQSVTDSEAGYLFVLRAQMSVPRFAISAENASAVAQICERLDGLPLAIELAAARCKLLTPQALLERLDSRLTALTSGPRDAPTRQRTLRNTIEWSYNLLEESEKTLFARLAVFQGGRSLEAIQAVCSKELPINVFEGLESLVNKNLIYQKELFESEPRFVMLETLHEYAWERLEASGEAETMRRLHAEYFVELVERAEPELRLAQQLRWSQQLEVEQENIRAVFEWSLRCGDVALGVRLAGALLLFWWDYGFHGEGVRWTQQLLPRLNEMEVRYHPKFLISAAQMIQFSSLEAANRLLVEALRISRELGDAQHAAWALVFLGYTMLEQPESAIRVVEEGLLLFRELNHKPGIAQALNIIGVIARASDHDRARSALEECLAICQQTGETYRICRVLFNLGVIAQHDGDHERVLSLMNHALRLAVEIRFVSGIAGMLSIFSASISALGQSQRAACLLGWSEAVFERRGAFLQRHDKLEYDRNLAIVRAQLDDATFAAAWAEGRAMTLEQAVAHALELKDS